MPPHFLCSCVRADGFNSKLQMLPEHNIVIVCTYSSGRHCPPFDLVAKPNQPHSNIHILTKYNIPIIFAMYVRVRPFVCNAYDCTQCVQGSIHNYNHIKTYVIKQNISSRRAADDRPYGFTFINYYLNGKILPLPVIEPILQSVRLAFTERRYNFPLSIFNFQLKKIPNTVKTDVREIFYLFTLRKHSYEQ